MEKFILFFCIFLSACLYRHENGCTITWQTASCDGKEFPPISFYQKKETIGHTNTEQRWKDIGKCGVKYGDIYLFSGQRKHKNDPVDHDMVTRLHNCVEKQGYIYITDCGRMNSVTDKKVCNM
ncbi:hypothetical protein [Lonepinella sp. BR2357]|uniref:hypothetical protein n=1 Tax=Lonepinella sp. BR2357 TaxID=3434549 RepID=UPI003F6E0636